MSKKVSVIKTPAKLGFLSFLGDVQGCGTIRIIHPYLLLNHFRTNQVSVMSQTLNHYCFDPEFFKPYTFAQFQRSATEHHYKLFMHFKQVIQKKYRIPIIYEIDDMLINIPEYNYAAMYYKKSEEWVKRCMGIADGMVVSTPYLKKVYSEYQKNITVIPNHLPKFIWGDIFPAHEYYDEDRKLRILWAGSQNHFSHKQMTPNVKGGDFGEELLKYIRGTCHIYDWYFVGAIPHELEDIKDKLCFLGWKHIFEYPGAVKNIEPDIAIAPLIDSEFNRCKSNIKMLEFVALGCPAVYSNTEPYKYAKCKANSDEEMIDYIEKMATDINFRATVFNRDYGTVKDQIWWEENENVRKYINSYLGLFNQRLP
jgi:hypothetical protein